MIKSQPCYLASHQGIALTLAGEQQLHAGCPGGCVEAGGKVVLCGCGCHDGTPETVAQVMVLAAGDPLPSAVVVLEADPEPARENRSSPRGTGRCEHCGAQTGGRFAPGHDAKLKSSLWKESMAGNWKSFAELYLRGWHKLHDTSKLPFEVEARGIAVADQYGYSFVERRNHHRIQGTTDAG